MTCKEFLPSLVSDNAVLAAQARLHAERCESCKAAAAMLDDVQAELSASEPLPPHLRQAWLSVAESQQALLSPAPQPARDRSALWWAALAASVLVALAAWGLTRNRVSDQAGEQPGRTAPQDVQLAHGFDERRVGPIEVLTVDPALDYQQMGGELAALEKLFAQVTADAERLAVREALDRVLVDYQRVFAANGSR